jgi:RNA polymerase sigma factor (sigma-70 family)
MAGSHASKIIRHVRGAALQDAAGLTDGQLLARFVEHCDAAAFAAIVHRHGRMVWGVCRRLVGHHDAEDAFQAAFLVLARKAASIRPREMAANWLYGVARQAALQVRRALARRRARERQVTEMPESEASPRDLSADLQSLLDLELGRLPDKYRVVIVLCDLEGKSRKETARQLGCPEGTVAGRLARARAMLARRMDRRGLAASGGALAAVMAEQAASTSVSSSVVSATIKTVNLLAAGQGAMGAASVKVVALTEGVLKAMLLTKLKTATAVLIVIAALSVGAGLTYRAQAQQTPAAQSQSEPKDKDQPLAKSQDGLERRQAAQPAGERGDGTALAQDGRGEFGFDISNGGIPLSFLTHKSVQEDLKMTDQQVKKADDEFQKHSEALRSLSDLKQQDRFQRQLELGKEAIKAVKDILDADQQKRLLQISLQQRGVRALDSRVSGNEPIVEELGLSEDQLGQISGIIKAAGEWISDARRGRDFATRGRDFSDEGNKKVKEIEEEMNAEVLRVLTSEQKAKWKEMTGKPFTGSKMIGR